MTNFEIFLVIVTDVRAAPSNQSRFFWTAETRCRVHVGANGSVNRWQKSGGYTMECYSATEKKEIPLLTGKWMQLKDMMLSEISQQRKAGLTYSLSLRKKLKPVTWKQDINHWSLGGKGMVWFDQGTLYAYKIPPWKPIVHPVRTH